MDLRLILLKATAIITIIKARADSIEELSGYNVMEEKRSNVGGLSELIGYNPILLAKKEQLLQSRLEKLLPPKLFRQMLRAMNKLSNKSSRKQLLHQQTNQIYYDQAVDLDEPIVVASNPNGNSNKAKSTSSDNNDMIHMFHRFG